MPRVRLGTSYDNHLPLVPHPMSINLWEKKQSEFFFFPLGFQVFASAT